MNVRRLNRYAARTKNPGNNRSCPFGVATRRSSVLTLQRFNGSTVFQLAFTLLEVMIAVGIFFIAMFAILGLVSQSLGAARALQQNGPTASSVAAEFTLTNRLEEGSETGDFDEPYRDYQWVRNVEFYASNGLFKVDYVVAHNGNIESSITFLLYRPESPTPASASRKFQK